MTRIGAMWTCLGLALVGCPGDPTPPEIPDDIFATMGEPVPYATDEQRATFDRGREVAVRQFTAEDGLGPHFNQSSCTGCHERPVPGGSGPRYRNFLLVGEDVEDGPLNFLGVSGIQPQYDLERVRFPTPEGVDVAATRNGIPFFGAGLLAEIPGESILVNEDPDDADGDGISGRANFDQGFVGRFGRKAQTVSVEGFIRGPLFNHLGLTSDPLSDELRARLPVPSASDTGSRSDALTRDDGDVGRSVMAQASAPSEPLTDDDGVPDPELSPQELFDVVSFAMLLAPPAPDPPTDQSEAGRELFAEMGCEGCHVQGLVSPRGLIPLWSDLLLHDMGPELADGIRMGLSTGSEFRTQPLWGVAPVGPYLHDGRADTLDEAIRWHGGEAQASRDAYVAANDDERGRVIAFLESLGGLSMRSEGLIPPNEPPPAPGDLGCAEPGTDMAMFERGRRAFDADFGLGAGLGPGFNGDSCRACHFLGAVGGAGTIDVNVTRQGISDGSAVTNPEGGTMAHRHFATSMRPPIDEASNFFELRQTPQIFGLGLVDRIPEAIILANADPDDLDGDGISGRAHVLPDGRLGRLGWKANVPNLAEFARDGMTNELGISVPDQDGLTFGSSTDDDETPDPEISLEDLEAVTFFMSHLAPPPRERTDPALEDMGEALFDAVGCADCHMTLSLEDGTPVPLYSDLLLHDVYAPGMLGVSDGDASGRELRTAPLWGLRVGAPYMHDGLASTVEDAIARHFSEAEASATAFAALSAEEREAVLAFLMSL